VIVGRKTFEGFRGSLPLRKNIVLTRNMSFAADGAVVKHSIGEALTEIADTGHDKVFVIGGEEIYLHFLPFCSYAYVTKIEASPESDTFFPDLDAAPGWVLERESGIRKKHPAASRHLYIDGNEPGIRFSYCLYRNDNLTTLTT